MSRSVSFYPNLAFGQIEYQPTEHVSARAIPSWLIDEPDVLSALQVLAGAGGVEGLGRAPDFHDAVIDLDAGTVDYQQVDW